MLEVVAADVRALPKAVTSRSYDVVLCRMVLHFLNNREEVEGVIRQMQQVTRVGGVNVVAMFTTRNPKGLRPYLAQPDELQTCYTGWKVLEEFEGLGRWFRPSPSDPLTRNYVARLTAQRMA
jgi:ubiquinone/menaquinone biosynthesis C-methylase UbiE